MQALRVMSHRSSIRQVSVDILLSATLLFCATVSLAAAAATGLELGTDYLWRSGIGFLVAVSIIWLLAIRASEFRRFGAANRITLLRVALLSLVAAAAIEVPTDELSWAIVGVVTVALILDGFDGHVARRTRTSSTFGARFDMETDAALIMVLSVLCWQFGKAGIWILAAGGMRYGFVLASRAWPWMRLSLPHSRRRQAVCILQSAGLLGVISPLVPYPASQVLAAGTLLMLGASFLIDIHWLRVQHRVPPPLNVARS